MPQSSLTIEPILALLAAAPARIATLTEGLTAAQLRTPPVWASGLSMRCWPITRFVYTYNQWLVVHQRPHLKQIQRIGNTIRE